MTILKRIFCTSLLLAVAAAAQTVTLVTANDLAPFSMEKVKKISAAMTVGPSITQTTNYLAMSPNADPALAKKIGDAVDAIKKSGKFSKIVESYK